MKGVAVYVGLVSLASVLSMPHDDVKAVQWKSFKNVHNKTYENPTEEKYREMIFLDNLRKVEQHNAKHAKGLVSFTLKINKYSDMLHSERVAKMMGFRLDLAMSRPRRGVPFVKKANLTLADQVDWRQQGAVTEVKDQGQCGSCWAFSSTGALEAQHFRKTGQLNSLSEQNLIDCTLDGKYGNKGCQGGWMDAAFALVKDQGGIDGEDAYPYEAADQAGCRYDPGRSAGEDSGWTDIPHGDEDAMMQAVSNNGPVSIAIDASHDSFGQYGGGVYDEPDCDESLMDHAITVVGYGSQDGQDYWLCKNSWGPSYGEGGYIKMSRNKNNQCAIASFASFPLDE